MDISEFEQPPAPSQVVGTQQTQNGVGKEAPLLVEKTNSSLNTTGTSTANTVVVRQQAGKEAYADKARDRRSRTVDISDLPTPGMRGETPSIKISARSVDKGLSKAYWEVDVLMSTGRTIHVDRNTLDRDMGYYASVLVDVDMTQTIPDKILVEVENTDIEFWQDVSVENEVQEDPVMTIEGGHEQEEEGSVGDVVLDTMDTSCSLMSPVWQALVTNNVFDVREGEESVPESPELETDLVRQEDDETGQVSTPTQEGVVRGSETYW
ncbi:hypothetical protein IFM89_006390 [Coptis chinensis]|uniref:Uncharacterized protein n=1 Tax=Coptis chinensis TaxID=261450 RepID=A0A835HRD2_9MAGN|nr:hypothetical protein IFM89_006390 [Coptis chinensis]